MSTLGEMILYPVAKALYTRKARHEKVQGKSSDDEYWLWQMATSNSLFRRYNGIDVVGKTVLDLGCGIGGRTCYLADKNPSKIVGIDTNQHEINVANDLAKKHGYAEKAEFLCVGEESDYYDNNNFDIVVMVDCLEHVENLSEILSLAYEKLNNNGMFYIGGNGWYHYNAAHMKRIIPAPFLSLLFSDTTILNVTRRILSSKYYIPSHFDSDPPVKRWEKVNDLKDRPGEHLNKMTISKIKKAFRESDFQSSEIVVYGFGSKKKILRILNLFSKIPVINEAWHSYVLGVGKR